MKRWKRWLLPALIAIVLVVGGAPARAEAHPLGTFAERIGWREVVVRPGDGVALSGATVPAQDQSDELRSYPQDMLTSPLNVRAAHASATFGAAPADALASATAAQPANGRVPDAF